ncbi:MULTISPECIES: PIN domain-containing protein [Halomicrobium]|uniref:Ribonuclease VapC n=2 Tax=Halomicrobium mukohataei TaxID=57705 RepID=C7NYX4_HALMD|nr:MULTISPECIES: PIN domain-containing protein [Halomicrobium]ACV48663.1 PilT protein domain protein [Halomicrobium mukohataei DSM 12286]QCD64094.1 type II toxin-antitoxin system VapC family toxin [Halomicrobium mukohataei]QFR18900.1 PIN domain-containing protein [Halomicrobium sp. ZPS1]
MIVDTSFVLDVIGNVEAAVTKERELEAESVPLVIPSMTVLELYIGVGKVANTRQERQAVEAVLDSYPVIDMTPSISRRAGRLLGERMAETNEDEGPGIGKGDATIAATALERDEPILTGDSHFENIPGITVETYR